MAAKQTRRRKSKITPYEVTECSWCDEMFDIDKFSDNACSCDQIFYLCCLEKDCNQRVWPNISKLQRHMQVCHLPRIKCLKCWKSFTRTDTMKAHMKQSCNVNKDSAKNKQKRR
jgi:hypothetical protein